jgi:hypothetical protein
VAPASLADPEAPLAAPELLPVEPEAPVAAPELLPVEPEAPVLAPVEAAPEAPELEPVEPEAPELAPVEAPEAPELAPVEPEAAPAAPELVPVDPDDPVSPELAPVCGVGLLAQPSCAASAAPATSKPHKRIASSYKFGYPLAGWQSTSGWTARSSATTSIAGLFGSSMIYPTIRSLA